jgi:hypothetical protein
LMLGVAEANPANPEKVDCLEHADVDDAVLTNDAVLINDLVEDSIRRLNLFAEAAMLDADMEIYPSRRQK